MNSEARNFSHTLKIQDLMLTNSSVSSSSPRRSYSFAEIVEDSLYQTESPSRVQQLEQDIRKKDSEIADLLKYNKQILEELQASRQQIKELSINHKQIFSLSKSLSQSSPISNSDLKHLIREVDYLKILYERGSLSSDSEVLNELINTLSTRNQEIKDLQREKENFELKHNEVLHKYQELKRKLKSYRDKLKTQKENFYKMYEKLQEKLNSHLRTPAVHIESLKSENDILRKKLSSKEFSKSAALPTPLSKIVKTLCEILCVNKAEDIIDAVKKRDKVVKLVLDAANEQGQDIKCTQKLQKWVTAMLREHHLLKRKFSALTNESLVLSQVRRCLGVNSNQEIFEKLV